MTYTDGNFLMADTNKELREAAYQLELPKILFVKKPFPHYLLDNVAQFKLKIGSTMRIKQMAPSEMLYQYYSRKKR